MTTLVLTELEQLNEALTQLLAQAEQKDWDNMINFSDRLQMLQTDLEKIWPLGKSLEVMPDQREHIKFLIQSILDKQNKITELMVPAIIEAKKHLGVVHSEKRLQNAYSIFS